MNEIGPTGEPREIKLRRLKLRSMRRGIKEMDLILGGFATHALDSLSDDDLALYDEMLSENDHDMYAWACGHVPAPDRFSGLIKRAVTESQVF